MLRVFRVTVLSFESYRFESYRFESYSGVTVLSYSFELQF